MASSRVPNCRCIWLGVAALGFLIGYPGIAAAQSAPASPVDFNRDIKPLLSGRCFLCHGPDESSREAGLRLDTFEGATADLGGYAAIVPGKPDESELIARVTSDDESMVMPPSEHGDALSKHEQSLLKNWIAAGGEYARHWSYVPPRLVTPPSLKDSSHAGWPRTDLDRFTLRAMIEHGLEPAPVADRLTLARRLALDLTGLPPTVDQADRFAASDDPQAYEDLVDELLASDAYGEHWAAMWLDLARYADSAGYAEDRRREIWAYRDYVIRSFQRNQPFDEFTVQQIAGDLLPQPTPEDRIATAFHRNTLTNSEGGTDDEEFRSAAVVDRTNTTLAVWMGTTMACAQCHTHKYDPITQEEYFQVYAILNNTEDADRPNESPTMPVYDAAARQKRASLQAEIERVDAELAKWKSQAQEEKEQSWAAAQQVWESEVRASLEQPIRGRKVRVRLPGKQKTLQLAEVQVFSGDRNLALDGTARQSSTYPGGDAQHAIDGNTDGAFENQSVAHAQPGKDPFWEVDLGSLQSVDRIVIWNRTDGLLHQRLNGFQLQLLDAQGQPVWERTVQQAPEVSAEYQCSPIPQNLREILQIDPAERSAEQAATLADHFRRHGSRESMLATERENWVAQRDQVQPTTRVPVMQERSQPRTTHIQIRGSFNDLGDEVQPGTPEAFHAISNDRGNNGPTRLDLAYWLVDRDNPLTARVVVNRYWQRLFGVGLVRTSEDFGAQGDLPTHPELLDHLAAAYMESGWDNRSLLKRIVLSATYRQQSRVTPRKRKLDPQNRWLSRGPRFRMSAEMVRDQALAVSGLLSHKMYGPPVMPPAPELNLKAAFSGKLTWNAARDEDRYRRAIYTLWRRSSPYPSMETFDVSNREVCDLRRISTNTPLQALVTLNDEAYVEAAQALARQMLQRDSDPRATARAGFRQVLIRQPSDAELDELVRLYEQTREHFVSHPDDARKLADDPLHPVPESTDWVSLASWTTVANVLLNLDEVLMKP